MSIKINEIKEIDYLVNGTTLDDKSLDGVVGSVIKNFEESAISKLKNCGLNEEQINKVKEVLRTIGSDISTSESIEKRSNDLRKRILAALKEEPILALNLETQISLAPVCPINEGEDECFAYMLKLPTDMMQEVFVRCVSGGYISSLGNLGCISKYFHREILEWNLGKPPFIEQLLGKPLKNCCPNLKIANAKALGYEVDDEPGINQFELIDAYRDVAEDDSAVLLLTIRKGSTVSQLFFEAREKQAIINVPNLSAAIRELPKGSAVKHSYRVLMVSGVSPVSLSGESYGAQCELAVVRECSLATFHELMALYVYRYNKCQSIRANKEGAIFIYSETNQYGQIWGINNVKESGKFELFHHNPKYYAKGNGGCVLVRRFF